MQRAEQLVLGGGVAQGLRADAMQQQAAAQAAVQAPAQAHRAVLPTLREDAENAALPRPNVAVKSLSAAQMQHAGARSQPTAGLQQQHATQAVDEPGECKQQ